MAALQAYQNEFGNCLVPQDAQYAGIKLGNWVVWQRGNKNRLDDEQIARLDALGFSWDPYKEQWEQGFSALEAYKREFGHCLVKSGTEYAGIKLAIWVGTQRSRKHRLSEEQIARLDELGFVWDATTEQWEQGFSILEAFKAEFGNCRVPARLVYKGMTLAHWVTVQRRNKNKLSDDQIVRLDALGFSWDPHKENWERGLAALQAYQNEFGNCLVSQKTQYQGMNLGQWVMNRRKIKKQLSKEQIADLDALGFVWKVK